MKEGVRLNHVEQGMATRPCANRGKGRVASQWEWWSASGGGLVCI